MGVSIEVYRSRIGSHHNFIHCRNRLHCLKGKLWNQILLMFYLNTSYFPYLKSQLKEQCRISRIFSANFWRVLRITKQRSEMAGVSRNNLLPSSDIRGALTKKHLVKSQYGK